MKKLCVSAPFATALVLFSLGSTAFSQTPSLQFSPTFLNYSVPFGSSVISATITVSASNGTAVPFAASASQLSGTGTWLRVTPTSATTPAALQVTIDPTGQAPGSTYQGQINLVSASTNPSSTSVPVYLTITGSAGFGVSPTSLQFDFAAGATAPASKALQVSGGATSIGFSAVASNSTWLSVLPQSGFTPASLSITVDPTKVPSGSTTASGNITIQPTTGGSPVIVPVTVNLAATPTITISPTSFTFNHQVGTTPPGSQTLSITSSGAQLPVVVSVLIQSGPPSWLVVNPVGTTVTNSPVTVSVNTSGLAAGSYGGFIVVNTGSATPTQIPVTLNVSTTPILTVSPSSLSINYAVGQAAPTATLNVGSTGAALTFVAAASTTSGGNWLAISSGATGQTPATVGIAITPSGLGPGTYTGTIALAYGGASPLNVPVTLTVTNNPFLVASPGALEFDHQINATPPPAQVVQITSTGGPLSYTVTSSTDGGGNWLSVISGSAGTTPSSVIVQATPGTLARGKYTGKVTVTAQGSTLDIPVTFFVSPSPLMRVSPPALSFTYQVGSTFPAAQTLSVAGTTDNVDPINYAVTFTTTSGQQWLFASPLSGRAPGSVTVTVLPTGLTPGTYSGSISLTGTLANVSWVQNTENSPVVVPVSLTVTAGALVVSNNNLTFSQAANGTAPAAQKVQITTSGSTALNFTASAVTQTGGNWLTVSPTSGTTPGEISITANGSALLPGTYTGTVTVSASGAPAPQNINVTLTVTAAGLAATPTSLTFTQSVGAPAPATQKIDLSSTGQALPFVITTTTTSGSNWLSVTPSSGNTPASLTVSVNGAGLTQGTYQGQITVTSAGAGNSPLQIPVTLTMAAQVNLVLAQTSLAFNAQQGGAAPAGQTVALSSSGAALPYTVSVSTAAGGNWLTATPTSGTTPGNINVKVDPANLVAGTYNGSVQVSSTSAGNSPQTINVVLTIAGLPLPVPTAIVNAATFNPGPVAPGEIVSVGGSNLGPTKALEASIVNNRVQTTLGDVRVLFDNIAAPLLYVSSTQINAVVPYEIAGRLNTRVQVEYKGQASTAVTLNVMDSLPGIFTANGSGTGPGAILNVDYSYNFQRPAPRGSIVLIYATGEGSTSPRGENGLIPMTAEQLKKPLLPVSVTVGGRPATIQYYGSAPQLVSGAMQVNVVIPDDAPSGNVPIVLTVGSNSSQPGVTVAVQ